jgi:uncharacterized membrane protein
MAMRQDELPTLHDYLDQQEEVTQEGFRVDTEEKANWALRKLRKIEEQRAENNALAEAEIEKINAWADESNMKADRDVEYFQGLLMKYAADRRKDDPKFKSLKLPNGKFGFRKSQPKFHYEDHQLLESLKASGKTDLIKVKESPDKATIKKKYTVHGDSLIDPDSGEILQGVNIEHRDDAFKWEVSE